MRTKVEILERARERISSSDAWCRGGLAYDRIGMLVGSLSEEAVRWCALGAMEREGVGNAEGLVDAMLLLQDAAQELGYGGVWICNDNGGHGRVMEMFDRALTEVKRDGDRECVTVEV